MVDKDKIQVNIDASLRLSARGRINSTVDRGSFEEWDRGLSTVNALDFPEYSEKLTKAQATSGETEAVVTGKATLDGIACVIGALEPDFMMGSMGSVVGEKVTRAFERATEQRLPVIMFVASGGARMQEGILSLMQMAKTAGAVKKHSDAGLLYVSVLLDPLTGGVAASFAMGGDIILAEPGALIGFAGPRVIEQTIGQKLPEGFQKAEFMLEKGFIDKIVPRTKMRETLINILSLNEVK